MRTRETKKLPSFPESQSFIHALRFSAALQDCARCTRRASAFPLPFPHPGGRCGASGPRRCNTPRVPSCPTLRPPAAHTAHCRNPTGRPRHDTAAASQSVPRGRYRATHARSLRPCAIQRRRAGRSTRASQGRRTSRGSRASRSIRFEPSVSDRETGISRLVKQGGKK